MEHANGDLDGSTNHSAVAKEVEETQQEVETACAPMPFAAQVSRKLGYSRSTILNDGHGLGNPASSFGARLNKVPSPISTLERSSSAAPAHEPVLSTFWLGQPAQLSQTSQLPPLNSMFGDTMNQINSRQIQTTSHFNNGDLQSTVPMVQQNPVESKRPVNPYAFRADEIGLRHGFPGVGAITDLLTPPDWQPGQEPIDEEKATQLYEKARVSAWQNANDFSKLVQHEVNRAQRLAAFDKRWQAQRRMDESILMERCKIHKAFLQFKHEHADVARMQRKQHRQQALYKESFQRPVLVTFQPPTLASYPVRQGLQQGQLPGDFRNCNDTPSPPLAAFHLNQRLQSMGLHLPGSPLSPSFLDPTLIPPTYDAVLHYYHQNKALINQYDSENERYLAVWSAKFNRQPPQGSLKSPYMSPTVGLVAGPLASVHYGVVPEGHVQAGGIPTSPTPELQGQHRPMPGPMPGSMPRPMPGPMPGSIPRPMPGPMPDSAPATMQGQHPTKTPATYGQTINTLSKIGQAGKRSVARLREVRNEDCSPKSRHRKRNSRAMTIYVPESHAPMTGKQGSKDYAFLGPEARIEREIGPPKEEATKRKPKSLQDEIIAANLPAPTISDEALRAAGVTPKSEASTQASGPAACSSKPKGRPRKAPFPSEGIRVPGTFGNALRMAGTREMRQRPLAPAPETGIAQSPFASTAPLTSKSGHTHIDSTKENEATSSGSMDSIHFSENALSSSSAKRTRSYEKATSEKSYSSDPRGNSIDDPDDPKDGDYGKRVPRKIPTVSVKRRSSVAASGPREKRSCQSLEGSNSNEAADEE